MKCGAKLASKNMTLEVENGDKCLTFRNCAKTANGCILGLKMTAIVKETAQAAIVEERPVCMDYWDMSHMILQ